MERLKFQNYYFPIYLKKNKCFFIGFWIKSIMYAFLFNRRVYKNFDTGF